MPGPSLHCFENQNPRAFNSVTGTGMLCAEVRGPGRLITASFSPVSALTAVVRIPYRIVIRSSAFRMRLATVDQDEVGYYCTRASAVSSHRVSGATVLGVLGALSSYQVRGATQSLAPPPVMPAISQSPSP